jgi:cell division protein FtsZ
VNEAAEIVRANTHPEANIIFGAVIDPDMTEEVHLTVIATGFDAPKEEEDVLDFAERSYEQAPGAEPRERALVEEDYSVRQFNRNDLDVPAFLRRSRRNGR